MGNKAGKRNSKKGRGGKRTSGSKGSKPGRAKVSDMRRAAKRARLLQRNGIGAGALLEPLKHEEQTQRNEPCPCGSGKKFKRCCSE